MKTFLYLLAILIVIPGISLCQDTGDTSIVGIWKGKIITTDKHLPYEIVISNTDGKLTGYSYTTYTVNAVEMVAVRAMKIENNNGRIVTTDDDLLFDSFDKSSPKQIRQTNTLVLKDEGESLTLNGSFSTKKTRDFRSLSGEISLTKEKEIKPTPLLVKLEELKLLSSLSFIKPVEEDRILVKKLVGASKLTPPVSRKSMVYVARPSRKNVDVPFNFPPLPAVARAEVKKPEPDPPPAPVKKVAPPPVKEVAKAPVQPKPVPVKPAAPVVKTPQPPPVVAKAPPVTQPAVTKTATTATAPSFAAALAKREIETIQTIHFKTDSLLLTLYDNGTVDGDTVSIILDGKMIMAKQGLTTNALNKTIYLPPGSGDSMQLVMYAENLGSLPPNTGLLIVRDGNERHEIRFSGNLEKNAAIILKRRRTE